MVGREGGGGGGVGDENPSAFIRLRKNKLQPSTVPERSMI